MTYIVSEDAEGSYIPSDFDAEEREFLAHDCAIDVVAEIAAEGRTANSGYPLPKTAPLMRRFVQL